MGIISFIQKHADEDQARAFVEGIVWKEGRYCPHCVSTHTNGIKRNNVYNGLYQCRDCRKQFTVTTKTIFHVTKIPLSKWLAAINIRNWGMNKVGRGTPEPIGENQSTPVDDTSAGSKSLAA